MKNKRYKQSPQGYWVEEVLDGDDVVEIWQYSVGVLPPDGARIVPWDRR